MEWALLYVLLAVCVVFFSIKLANYVDLIDKKTDLSGAFIGGVILAAVTSLPELFTSISAVCFVKQPTLVIGNILGSNLFNMCIWGGACLFSAKNLCKARVGKSHFKTTIITLVMFGLMVIPIVLGKDYSFANISIYSVLIIVLYGISIKSMAGDTAESDDECDSPLTLKQIVIRFIIMAILLVIASFFITIVTDKLANVLNLGATVAGALFLGIATSLPELTSSIALIKKGNFNACAGNVLGSGVFNFCILAVADLLYKGGSVYISNEKSSAYLTIFGAISMIIAGIMLFVKNKALTKENGGIKAFYRGGGVLIFACYAGFLIMSN